VARGAEKKAAWLSAAHDLVREKVPDIETRKEQDYWPTLTYLFYKGLAPYVAAQIVVKRYSGG